MKTRIIKLLICTITVLFSFGSTAKVVTVKISPVQGDCTTVLRKALEHVDADKIRVEFQPGIYLCRPDYAIEKYCTISNHGNGLKKILFSFDSFDSIQIVGHGATILCHGQLFPFLFENCRNVEIHDLTIDWDIPFTFLCQVLAVNKKEGWRDIRPLTQGFSWKYEKNQIHFPDIDGFSYDCLGSTLPFNPETKRVVDGAIDVFSRPNHIERLSDGVYRIHEHLKYYPPVGSLLSSKGDRMHDRYAPAFDFKECQSVKINNVVIHHALGMGFLFERSEDIQITNSDICLSPRSERVVSTTADATHFVNCKGQILIEGCQFSNMLDDGTNVHGTYMLIDRILDNYSLIAKFGHFEQKGFKFADKGEEVWFIKSPSPDRSESNTVVDVIPMNEEYVQISFLNPLSKDLKNGDLVENKSFNPDFTMRKCKIFNHRARNIVLKTPGKIIIEGNEFSSMMSSVLFRGESRFWYESGQVNDVLIRDNHFMSCAECGTRHAVIYITPRLGKQFSSDSVYDKNITIENNTVRGANPCFIIAESCENLNVNNNVIISKMSEQFANRYVYEFYNTEKVRLRNNKVSGVGTTMIYRMDNKSKKSIEINE